MSTINKEKTILIVSSEGDYSAKRISDWAYYYCKLYGKKFKYINSSKDAIAFSRIEISDEKTLRYLQVNDVEEIELEDIQAIFFRSGSLAIANTSGIKSNKGLSFDINSRVGNFLMARETNVRGFLLESLNELNKIGNDNGNFTNKIWVLRLAQKHGMKIPQSLLTSNKTHLLKFFEESVNGVITKSIGLSLGVSDVENNKSYTQFTELITRDSVEKFPENFALTLFQKRVDKLFEIRSFYLRGDFYSCAMYTQQNNKTSLDYRHYDEERPTRIVPFNMPNEVQIKLNEIMSELKFETGSFDIIYTPEGEYLLLEVNPGGQYGANSDYCNFYLNRAITKQMFL